MYILLYIISYILVFIEIWIGENVPFPQTFKYSDAVLYTAMKPVRTDGKKILSEKYLSFVNDDYLETFSRDVIDIILDNIDYQYYNHKLRPDRYKGCPKREEARVFIILLWATGARPVELLKMQKDNIIKYPNHLAVKIPEAKHGKSRTLELAWKDKKVKEVWEYAAEGLPFMYLFPRLRSDRVRNNPTATRYVADPETGVKKKERYTVHRSYPILSQKVNYYFTKWVYPVYPDLTPYVFRHNRFTIVADTKGFDYKDILKMKGGKSLVNVEKYIHVSKERREKWKKVLLK
jgi:integrase